MNAVNSGKTRARPSEKNPERAAERTPRRSGGQGIRKDGRGQEQPADKKRAQQNR